MNVDRLDSRLPITAIVLTLNEEAYISRCVARLNWVDEVLVVDSGSTDSTQQVARQSGARVLEQPWLGWSKQRNRGAASANNDWVFFVEADEIVTQELELAIREVFLAKPLATDAFALDRRDEFMGRLMPQAQRSNTVRTFVRIYNRTSASWDERSLVHERVIVSGKRHRLPGTLAHWRKQTLIEQASRIVGYADVEARSLDLSGRQPSRAKLIFHPIARFLWLYAARGGWKRGTPGLVHATLRAFSDFMRHARHYELHQPPTPFSPPGYE